MNRRNFFGNLLKVGASFAILPSATLYARKWKASKDWVWQENLHLYVQRYDVLTCEFQCFFIDEPPMFDERILAQV